MKQKKQTRQTPEERYTQLLKESKQPPKLEPESSHVREPWTQQHDDWLREYYPKYGGKYTAKLLGRSLRAVVHRAYELHALTHEVKRWSEAEDKFLRENYGRLTAEEIARKLKRTELSVRHRINKKRLVRTQTRAWTKEEMRFLRKHYGEMPRMEIARQLDRTLASVDVKAGKLGLRQSKAIFQATPSKIKQIVAQLGKVPYTEIAREFNTHVQVIARIAAEHGYRDRPTSRLWTEEDDRRLHELYGTMSRQAVADKLDRTMVAVAERARQLRLAKRVNRPKRIRPWTTKDRARLRRMALTMTAPEIAHKLNRSLNAVNGQAKALGIVIEKKYYVAWSAEEDAQLRALLPSTSRREIAQRLGRTLSAVRARLHTLGLTQPRPAEHFVRWSAAEDKVVRKMIARKATQQQIAERLGRTPAAVSARVRKLGLQDQRVVPARRWTPREDEQLRTLYGTMPKMHIAKKIGRPWSSLLKRIEILGLNGQSKPRK